MIFFEPVIGGLVFGVGRSTGASHVTLGESSTVDKKLTACEHFVNNNERLCKFSLLDCLLKLLQLRHPRL
jgi:hypothetical protein